ncbi:MAG: response regulator [Pseudomonadota bacterium]
MATLLKSNITQPDVRGRTVLIIDDDPNNLAIMSDHLEEAGLKTLVAEDGESGLQRAAYARPDLIMLDIMMPGMDGLETCRRLKEQEGTRDIPVIFMTALADMEHKVRGFEVGGVDYITKPFQRDEVLARIFTHLRIRELTGRLREANETLERRVEERTAELARANEELRVEIHERRQVQDALKKSEEKYSKAFLLSPDSCVITRLTDGVILEVNDIFLRIMGCSRDEVVGKTSAELNNWVDPKDRKAFASALKNTGQAVGMEAAFYAKDNQIHFALISGQIIELEGELCILSVARDISERKRAEEALNQLKIFLDKIINAIPDPIFVKDRKHNWVVLNDAYCTLMGHDRSELLGKSDYAFFPENEADIFWDKDEEVFTGGAENINEESFTDANKVVRTIITKKTLYVNEKGENYIVGIIRDITEQRRLEEQLRQAVKMEAIGTLAGGVAHDFNNLMTVVIGFCDIALQHIGKEDRLLKDIEQIRKAGQRAALLTNQLLAFSRKQVVQPKVLNLNELMTETEKMLKRLIGEDIDLVCVPDAGLAPVMADPGLIGQVIINMAINARDAMPRGGKLTMETANVYLGEEYARQHLEVEPGHHVMLAVSDTGCGMDAATMSRIFEPFFTTKSKGKGTGLGLAVVYGIVKQSGGHIWVYSEPGRGATFKVYLPSVAQNTRSLFTGARPEHPHTGGSETVLLVEDDDGVREAAGTILRSYGYTVLEAHNGHEALKVHREQEDPIHILITDVVMPGMNGRELAREIETLSPLTKVLYISGYTDNAIVHHGVLDAGTAFLQKPFTPEALARKVREVLET